MGQDARERGSRVTESRPPEQIQEDIEVTRQELGDTIEALAEKVDIRGQAKQKVADARQAVMSKKDELLSKRRETSPSAPSLVTQAAQKARENPLAVAAASAFAAGFIAGRLSGR
jgi:ElaB/YqjD/DUF883 family membrane-anchored ribosome-binding protein